MMPNKSKQAAQVTKTLIFVRRVCICGPLAQSAERGADNAKAVSSTLTRTNLFFHFRFSVYSCFPFKALISTVDTFSRKTSLRRKFGG